MKTTGRIIQEFLDSKEPLVQENLKSDSGFHTTRKYTGLVDRLISALMAAEIPDPDGRKSLEGQMTLVALGSYGRRELCFASDVDLLILYQGGLSEGVGQFVPRILYPLWDARLEVGHSVLTVEEGVRLALEDFRSLTSLMDGRFVLGSWSLYQRFRRSLWSVLKGERERLLGHFLLAKEVRERRFGRQGYFAEPDLKEGLGGIRDLHFMAWMAKLYFRCGRLSRIRRYEPFSHFDTNRLNHSKGFLFKVRNHLHILAKRKEDRLMSMYQEELARDLGFRDGSHVSAAEKFMRRLYMHLNRVKYGAEEFHTKALDLLDPSRGKGPPPQDLHPEFSVHGGNLVLRTGSLLEKSPLVLLEGFSEANRRGLFLGSGFIWESRKRLAQLGKGLLRVPGAREAFLDLVMHPENPKILRLALEIGLIGLFIPEFKRIRNLALFSYYHQETVDIHSLKTVETIRDLSKGLFDDKWPVLREVFEETEHPEWLFLAALLHDIGKGYRGDHAGKGAELIPRILERLGLEGSALEMVPFLVEHHLLLARIAQRRDLNEEKTCEQVAQVVRDPETLRMLFILTAADTLCSGAASNRGWRLMLLQELYFKVRHILEGDVVATPSATERVKEVTDWLNRTLRPHFLKKDILALVEQVPTRYLLETSLEDISRHFRLALAVNGGKLAWVLQKLKHVPVTRIILRTTDRPGLFSKMVGVFTLNNIEVLSAKICTVKNGLALDIYEVSNPRDPLREEETWKRLREEAIAAMEDRLSLETLIAAKKRRRVPSPGPVIPGLSEKVRMDNTASDFYTILEVSARDRFGFLYSLSRTIRSLGLDIRFARVDSDKTRITGVFYVCGAGGRKVTDRESLDTVKREILKTLGSNGESW
ncbi:MAG: [protein-PII] uridylyltransferase [Deltaproteobacteria bacterium]|nr:[protein-PII] uridylyltransferase [Deltaproteobacteria bacterium]